MNCSRILIASLAIFVTFIFCDSDNPASPSGGGNNNSDLTISLSINRDHSWYPEALGGVERTCLVYAVIKRNSEPITDANVEVNGTAIPFEPLIVKQYMAELDYSVFTPNQKVKCSITIDGKTAEEEVTFPGDITPSTDGSSVSWKHEGDGDFIYIQEIESEENGRLSSNATYESIKNSNDLSSPATIPASAYPKTGTSYLQTTVVRNSVNNAFSSFSPLLATIVVNDLKSVKIVR